MILRFLKTLHDCGRAQLEQPERDLLGALRRAGTEFDEAEKLQRLLRNWHEEAVLDLPGAEILFHAEAAVWGAILLFRTAFLTSFREIEASEFPELLQSKPMPGAENPAAHFSADLCLRHWPALARMARAQSEDDSLVKVIHDLAEKFPLSSLGMNFPIPPENPIIKHPGLRQFFAERALERADHANLELPEIDKILRSKLGSHSATLGRGLLTSPPQS